MRDKIAGILQEMFDEVTDDGFDSMIYDANPTINKIKSLLAENLKKLKRPVSQFDKDLASDFNRHEGVVRVITNATIDNIIAIVKEDL